MAQAPQLASSRATLERLEKLKTDVNVFGEMKNLYLDMGTLTSTLYKQNLNRITRIEDSLKRLGGGLKKLTDKLISNFSQIETRIKKLEDRDAATAAQGLVQLQGNKRQRISGGRKKHKTKRVRKKHKKKTKKRRRKRKTKKRRR
jgi:hypothetical protein